MIARIVKNIVPPIGLLVIALLLLEFVLRVAHVPEYLIPTPTSVLRVFGDDSGELWSAFSETSMAAGLGFLLSFIVGTLAAIALSSSSFVRRAILPYAVFFQTVPVIAIAPILVIWFGFGMPTVVASAFIVSIFPVIASTLLGLQSTDPALIELFRLYSASPMQLLVKLKLPYAMPQVFSGLRIAAGLAVIGAVVGEFIAGGGLGAVVDVARTQQRTDKVFAAVLLSAALGLLFVSVVNALAWWALRRWHASAQTR